MSKEEPEIIDQAKKCCKTGKMKIITQFAANAPPIKINDKRKSLENSK